MNVSVLGIHSMTTADSALELGQAVGIATRGDAAWLVLDGEVVGAVVPPDVLRFYARFNDLIPDHPEHHLDGPVECDRCQLLRDNAHWLFTDSPDHTADGTASSAPSATDSSA